MSSKRALTAAILLAVGPAASAATLDYTLGLGIEHSDNINLSATDPISQNVLIPRGSFDFTQAGSTVQANISGTTEYRDYLGGAFNNEFRTDLSGRLNWSVAPQRLDLTVEDYAAVEPINVRASNTPSNQQQTNVLVLGPTLYFRLGTAWKGQAELRYVDSYAEKTEQFNSRRGRAALRLARDISPTDRISGNIEGQHVDFYKAGSGPDYDRYNVFARYVSTLAEFDLDAALGWSKLEFSDGTSNSDPLVRASASWRATPRSTFTIDARRQYSDAADDLSTEVGQFMSGAPIYTGDRTISSEVYLEKRLQASYAFTTERFNARIAPVYRKYDYVNDNTLNLTGHGGSLNMSYRLRESIDLTFLATEETRTFEFVDRSDETLSYALALTHHWRPHWSWSLSLLRNQRTSSAPDQGYHENQIYYSVQYSR